MTTAKEDFNSNIEDVQVAVVSIYIFCCLANIVWST